MITASVINGGPGFPYLSCVLYKYLTSLTDEIDNVLTEITKEDVVDWSVLQAIEKVTDVKFVLRCEFACWHIK